MVDTLAESPITRTKGALPFSVSTTSVRERWPRAQITLAPGISTSLPPLSSHTTPSPVAFSALCPV